MSYALFAIASAIALLAVIACVRWKRRLQVQGAVRDALVRIYSPLAEKPRIEVLTAYGFPVFNVLFRNYDQLTRASEAGLNKAFVQEMSIICKPLGKAGRPFNPELAVSFAHENILTRADLEAQ